MRRESHLSSEQPNEMRLAELNQSCQRVERYRARGRFEIVNHASNGRVLASRVAKAAWRRTQHR